MKKFLITLIVLVALAGAGVAAYYYKYGKPVEPEVASLPITRGDISQVVSATGTLESVITVNVGTQVNGIIKELYTDFNQIVRKGQLLAKIDPATIEAKIEQDNAQLASAVANRDRLLVTLEDSRNKLRRAEDLAKRLLITQQDLETAQVNLKTADAQLKAQDASINQVKATINQDKVSLGYTDIYAPIDGIIINRVVDIGQTVVSNNAATPMFQIAADLTQMQVKANIDESDVGLIRPGQHTTFRVDAFPTKEFTGTVSQVRLQPVVQQNVVTYVTIINVPNNTLELKPGMTASVKVEIARRENVLRIPNAAIRFRPTEEIFTAFKQEMPQELRRGRGGMGGSRGGGQFAAGGGQQGAGGNRGSDAAFQRGGGDRQSPAGQATFRRGGEQPAAGAPQGDRQRGQGQGGQQGQWTGRQGTGERGGQGGGQQMSDQERMARMKERLAQMTPEQREQFMARMKERGIDPNNPQSFGRGGERGGQRGQGGPQGQFAGRQGGRQGQAGASASTSGGFGSAASMAAGATPLARAMAGGGANGIVSRGAETIDALFGPLPPTEMRNQRVWTFVDKKLKMIGGLRTGITDGTFTELIEGPLTEKTVVVTSVDLGLAAPAANRNNTANPLNPMGGRGGMGGPGGMGGGRPGGGR